MPAMEIGRQHEADEVATVKILETRLDASLKAGAVAVAAVEDQAVVQGDWGWGGVSSPHYSLGLLSFQPTTCTTPALA